MAKRLSRIERDIERLKEKISEYQQQLKELEAAKTEQENLQIIQLVRSMNMKPDEFAAFLRSGALNAAPKYAVNLNCRSSSACPLFRCHMALPPKVSRISMNFLSFWR